MVAGVSPRPCDVQPDQNAQEARRDGEGTAVQSPCQSSSGPFPIQFSKFDQTDTQGRTPKEVVAEVGQRSHFAIEIRAAQETTGDLGADASEVRAGNRECLHLLLAWWWNRQCGRQRNGHGWKLPYAPGAVPAEADPSGGTPALRADLDHMFY